MWRIVEVTLSCYYRFARAKQHMGELLVSEAVSYGRDYWLDIRNYHNSWDSRARFAAKHIRKKWVSDIGCGRQSLSRYLAPDAIYLPSDITAWDRNVEVCDLNIGHLPERSLALCDVAVLLGVVQRIHDLPQLFSEMSSRAEHLVVSYHADRTRSAPGDWTHSYSTADFSSILGAAGYSITRQVRYGQQTIWYATSNCFSTDVRAQRDAVRMSYAGPTPGLMLRLRRMIGV